LLHFFAEKAKCHILSETSPYKNILIKQRIIHKSMKKFSTIFLLIPRTWCEQSSVRLL
jgi:hypothetical protein